MPASRDKTQELDAAASLYAIGKHYESEGDNTILSVCLEKIRAAGLTVEEVETHLHVLKALKFDPPRPGNRSRISGLSSQPEPGEGQAGLHPNFGRYVRGEMSPDDYADDLAARVDTWSASQPSSQPDEEEECPGCYDGCEHCWPTKPSSQPEEGEAQAGKCPEHDRYCDGETVSPPDSFSYPCPAKYGAAGARPAPGTHGETGSPATARRVLRTERLLDQPSSQPEEGTG